MSAFVFLFFFFCFLFFFFHSSVWCFVCRCFQKDVASIFIAVASVVVIPVILAILCLLFLPCCRVESVFCNVLVDEVAITTSETDDENIFEGIIEKLSLILCMLIVFASLLAPSQFCMGVV